MQCLDGVFTYLGVAHLGPDDRGQPAHQLGHGRRRRRSSASAARKLVAIGFGMLLHLRRVHNLVALLTAIYFAVAILPWTALFLTN